MPYMQSIQLDEFHELVRSGYIKLDIMFVINHYKFACMSCLGMGHCFSNCHIGPRFLSCFELGHIPASCYDRRFSSQQNISPRNNYVFKRNNCNNLIWFPNISLSARGVCNWAILTWDVGKPRDVNSVRLMGILLLAIGG